MTSLWKPALDDSYYYRFMNETANELQTRRQLYRGFLDRYEFDRVMTYYIVNSLRKLLDGDRSYNAGLSLDTPPSGASPSIDHARVFRNSNTRRTVLLSMPYRYTADQLHNYLKDTGAVWYAEPQSRCFYHPTATPILIMSVDTLQYYQSTGAIPADAVINH